MKTVARHIGFKLILLTGLCHASMAMSADALAMDPAIQNEIELAECPNGEKLKQVLEKKSHSPAHRDLGWRLFDDSTQGLIIERAFLVNKGMELRYRWRRTDQDHYIASNERAHHICPEAHHQTTTPSSTAPY